MGWTSLDALINDITVNGKQAKLPFNRVIVAGATSVLGRWHEAVSGLGTGGSMVLTSGSPGVGIAMNRATVGALPLNANVATDIRRLLSMMAITGVATVVPGLVLLTDIIHIYPSCVLTGSPTAPSNHPSWVGSGVTRLANANGVQLSLVVTTAGSAGNGTITASYKDQDDNAATAGAMYAPATTAPIGSLYGQTGAVITVGGPFFPLAAGDVGVRNLESYAINVNLTSGVGTFILHRPIAVIPLAAVNVAGERDFLSGIPTLPQIYDDACLGMFVQIGGSMPAGSGITGEINYGWGA